MTTTIFPKLERWRRGLAAIVLLLMSISAQAAVTAPFTADFKVSRSGIPLGTATFRLQHADRDGCYLYTGHAYPNFAARMFIGNITEKSRFCIDDGTIRTQRFTYHIDGQPDDSYTLRFNWAAHQVRYQSEDGDTKTLTLGAQAYDPLSIQIAARQWIAQAENPAQLPDTAFPLVDEDEIKPYRLHVADGGTIKTPGGTFDTLLVERAGHTDHQLKLWLARGANWIPIRVVQSSDEAYRMNLTRLIRRHH